MEFLLQQIPLLGSLLVPSIRGAPLANTGPGHVALRRILLQFQQQKTRLAGWQGHFESLLQQLLALCGRGLGSGSSRGAFPPQPFCDCESLICHLVMRSEMWPGETSEAELPMAMSHVDVVLLEILWRLWSCSWLRLVRVESRSQFCNTAFSPYLRYAHYTEWNQLIPTEEWVPGLSISHQVRNCSVAHINIALLALFVIPPLLQ